MLLKEEAEQSTDVVHLNNTLKVLLTDKLEMESVAVIVIAVEEPMSVVSDELIEIEEVRLNQTGWEDTDQVIFVATPAGFVTSKGSARVRGVPIHKILSEIVPDPISSL